MSNVAPHKLSSVFSTDLPIVQAPMAGIQGSRLAIAVSNAGGLGSLPCAMLSEEKIEAELTLIKSHTDKPFNLNFFATSLRRLTQQPRRRGGNYSAPTMMNLA